METLAIKVKIGDREYPMRVKPEDEGKIRHAGRVINEKLRKYKSEFGLDDSIDLLAMVAFDCMVESLETNSGNAVLLFSRIRANPLLKTASMSTLTK